MDSHHKKINFEIFKDGFHNNLVEQLFVHLDSSKCERNLTDKDDVLLEDTFHVYNFFEMILKYRGKDCKFFIKQFSHPYIRVQICGKDKRNIKEFIEFVEREYYECEHEHNNDTRYKLGQMVKYNKLPKLLVQIEGQLYMSCDGSDHDKITDETVRNFIALLKLTNDTSSQTDPSESVQCPQPMEVDTDNDSRNSLRENRPNEIEHEENGYLPAGCDQTHMGNQQILNKSDPKHIEGQHIPTGSNQIHMENQHIPRGDKRQVGGQYIQMYDQMPIESQHTPTGGDQKPIESWQIPKESYQTHMNSQPLPTEKGQTESDYSPKGTAHQNFHMGKHQEESFALFSPLLYRHESGKAYVHLTQISVTEVKTDAVVIATDDKMKCDKGIAEMVYRLAGHKLRQSNDEYIKQHHKLDNVCVLPASEPLPAKNVMHVLGCSYRIGLINSLNPAYDPIEEVFNDIYKAAKKHGLKSVAIPPILAGKGAASLDEVVKICIKTLVKFLKKENSLQNLHIHFIDIGMEFLCDIQQEIEKCSKFLKIEDRGVINSCMTYLTAQTDDKKNLETPPSDPAKIEHYGLHNTYLHQMSNVKVHVIFGDILKMNVDAIVNPANGSLNHAGGLAYAIVKHGGSIIDKECGEYLKKKKYVGVTKNCVTTAGKLPAKHIIHAVGPIWVEKNKERCRQEIYYTFWNILTTAENYKMKSVAIPAISTGIFHMPEEEVAKGSISAIIDYLNGKVYSLQDVYLIDANQSAIWDMNMELQQAKEVSEYDQLAHNSQYGATGTSNYNPTSEKPSQPKSSANDWPQSYNDYQHQHSTHHRSSRNNDKQLKPTRHHEDNILSRQNSHNYPRKGNKNSSEYPTTSLEKSSEFKTSSHEVTKSVDAKPKKSDECSICLCEITNPKTLHKCKHTFCRDCIDLGFKHKPVCPVCATLYGKLTGNQPRNGTMISTKSYNALPGYEHYGTIEISYNFPSGTQSHDMPDPGKPYTGTRRRAFLPDNREGNKVLKLLKEAFDSRLVFTVGRSTTTGQEAVVTWNDIHHKTSRDGGPTKFGYPDPGYLSRVQEELAAKGIK